MADGKCWVVFRKIEVAKGQWKYARTDNEVYLNFALAQAEAKRRTTATADKHVVKRVELIYHG